MQRPTGITSSSPAWRTCLTLAMVLAMGGIAAGQGLEPIDLNTWSQQGFSGNWVVAADGNSVLQLDNGPPTFFISPDDFIDTTLRGAFEVETVSDDDFIGFVFGYNNPLGAETTARDFFLLDWKQVAQTFNDASADVGLTLARVVGDIPPGGGLAGSDEEIEYFFGHPDTGPTPDANGVIFDVLGANQDVGGWMDQTTYNFELLYQQDRIRVRMSGGQFGPNLQTIFDILAADVGGGPFEAGRFGFYNLSQEQVRYHGFTQQDTPVTEPNGPTIVPSPAALPAGLVLLAGWCVRNRRRC